MERPFVHVVHGKYVPLLPEKKPAVAENKSQEKVFVPDVPKAVPSARVVYESPYHEVESAYFPKEDK